MHRGTAVMDPLLENTTLICVATNATLDHHEAQRVAIQAHDGFARAVQPAHTFADGDVAFVISMAKVEARPEHTFTVGLMAARAVERAVVRAVWAARGTAKLPSAAQWLARTISPGT
jgi:L-aminopeptidase/D-esterase-like protein